MKQRTKYYLYILIISIIISIPLLNEKFNIYYDDGIQHICRLIGTYQSITENQAFSVIMSNFCNNFGYSWNLFYSPVTAYIPLLLHFITHSFILDLKIFIILVTLLSGITMYEFLYKVTKNMNIGLLGAAIYILAPYRLTDMYMRIAIAELTSFIFLPLIFQGLYSLFKDNEDKRKCTILIILGASLLILTHTVIAMYTAIICFIYVVFNIKKLKDITILKQLFFSLILIVCITSFFWVPMFEHKLNTNYEVFKSGRMERTEVLVAYKLDVMQLFHTEPNKMFFEIGLITLIGVVFTMLVYKKIEERIKGIYFFSLIMGIISVFMSLKYFPFEKLPSILKMLQFSFRMLEFSSFFLSFVVAINFGILIKNFNIKDVIILSILSLFLIIPFIQNLKFRDNINEDILWPAVPVTNETERVHAGCASFEYLPSRAFGNLNYIKSRENRVYITDGNARILNENKNGTDMKFNIQDIEKNTVLELPYIYYLGYEVQIENEGKKQKLDIFESKNGFVEVHLEDVKEGTISVSYKGTIIMKITMVISILSFTYLVFLAIRNTESSKSIYE